MGPQHFSSPKEFTVSKPIKDPLDQFLDSALSLGCEFLTCGGPVGRLEEQIALAGSQIGLEIQAHATPSSLTVSGFSRETGEHRHRIARISNFNTDLGKLRSIDRLLSRFSRDPSRSELSLQALSRLQKRQGAIPYLTRALCLFGIGLGVGHLSGATGVLPVIMGLITWSADLVPFTLCRHADLQKIFYDFLLCISALFFASLASIWTGTPAINLALGAFALVVPGLLMTSGISEIVDQNYLSGTIRLVKAIYTFLAMALALTLTADVISSLKLSGVLLYSKDLAPEPAQLLFSILSTILLLLCFSILFRAHRKSLPRILICGLSGKFIFILFFNETHLALTTFLASLWIGGFSAYLGKKSGHPSQIYSAPSIITLTPGMLAFTSLGYGGLTQSNSSIALQALLLSLAIVFGLAAGKIPWSRRDLSPE